MRGITALQSPTDHRNQVDPLVGADSRRVAVVHAVKTSSGAVSIVKKQFLRAPQIGIDTLATASAYAAGVHFSSHVTSNG
jgi:hypothetical protein